jgi:CubicO group peptidase (beta-lactamase class C family)
VWVLEDVVSCSEAPGISVAVVSKNKIVASAAAGVAEIDSGLPMSIESACNWFSMTKIASATAAMMLADRGELDLEAPVSGYLADIWPTGFAAVTVRHLLNHTSGLRNPIPIRWVHRAGDPQPDQRLFLARLLKRQQRPRCVPGTRAAYSNVGYLALGVVIAEVSGRSYETFVREELLEPLGMLHTAYHWDDPALRSIPRATGYQRASRLTAWSVRLLLPPGIVGGRSDALVALNSFEVDGAAYGGLIGPVTDAARLLALHCTATRVSSRADVCSALASRGR